MSNLVWYISANLNVIQGSGGGKDDMTTRLYKAYIVWMDFLSWLYGKVLHEDSPEIIC